MTFHPPNNGDYLVEVQAQVMTRDDSTQCWLPMGGGGLSNVKLCKLARDRHSPTNTSTNATSNSNSSLAADHPAEYIIHGERLADKSVVIDCVLKKDIQYTKANPKFHHWNTDEKRFGLTFERCDDANAFDDGIRHAVAELNEGLGGEADERIFQIVDLPLGQQTNNGSSQSASTTSTTTSSPSPHSPCSALPPGSQEPFLFTHPHANHHHLHRVHYMPARTKPKHATSTTTTTAVVVGSRAGGGGRGESGGGGGGDRDRDSDSYHMGGGSSSSSPPPNNNHHHSGKSSPIESWNGLNEEVWVRSDEHNTSHPYGKSHHHHHHHHHPHQQQDTGLLRRDVVGGGGEVVGRSEGGGGGGGVYKEEPYVIFAKSKAGAPHEYSYPSLEPVHKPPAKRESTSTKKQPLLVSTQPYPPLPIKTKSKKHNKGGVGSGGVGGLGGGGEQSCRLVSQQRSRCKHCRVMFAAEDNVRGSCDSAPDTVAKCIECVTCVSCTPCMIYHCMADADGEYSHPCVCDSSDDSNCKKWTALTILSFIIPCLWCYPPLHACHKCGTACGLCGGRHKAA